MSTGSFKIESITHADMVCRAVTFGINKARLPLGRMVLLSMLAGMYIGFGCLLMTVITTGSGGILPYGVTRILGGLIFCLGLILVVVGGAELFTGNSLMVIAWIDRKISMLSMLRNWLVVYLGNFLGAVILAALVFLSREYRFGQGEVGKTILNLALVKVNYPFLQALVLGILCNILVCLAVWMTYGGSTVADKVTAIIFPITAFVAAGFEHSVANMYALPIGWMIRVFDPAFAASTALDLNPLTWQRILINNLLPVTIGNMIGGALFVGAVYAAVYLPIKSTKPAPSSQSR